MLRPRPALRLLLPLALGCVDAPPEAGRLPPPQVNAAGVVLYTSPDALTWTRVPGTVHDGLQSLGLSVRPDGALWVSGLNFRGRASLWEAWVTGPPVRGLVFDGERWEEEAWPVDDDATPNFIDPQWLGDEVWYVSRPGKAGDPALDGARNVVRSAPPAADRLALASVTDPSPVRFGGALHLFVTTGGTQVEHWTGEPLRRVNQWGGITVPFATEVNGELWLLAQQVINGKRQPIVARSRDARTWTPWAPMIPWDSVESCTSPVMGPHPRGGWVLLCVEEKQP